MMFPIKIKIYPLMGGFRAECVECGAYGTSEQGKKISQIGEALENLAKNQNTFSDKSKACPHFYGNYKPRVVCLIKFKDLSVIKETFFTQGDEKFPAILLDNKYRIDVEDAKGLTYTWSPYSYVRHIQPQELQTQSKPIENKPAPIQNPINIKTDQKDPQYFPKWKPQLLTTTLPSITEPFPYLTPKVKSKSEIKKYISYLGLLCLAILWLSLLCGAVGFNVFKML